MSESGSGEAGTRLMALAEQVGAKLVARGETVAIAESSAGGLISAALLSVGGASRYFRGGAVVYTKDAKMSFLQIDEKNVIELAEAGKLPGKKLGPVWRFSRDALVAWLSTPEEGGRR